MFVYCRWNFYLYHSKSFKFCHVYPTEHEIKDTKDNNCFLSYLNIYFIFHNTEKLTSTCKVYDKWFSMYDKWFSIHEQQHIRQSFSSWDMLESVKIISMKEDNWSHWSSCHRYMWNLDFLEKFSYTFVGVQHISLETWWLRAGGRDGK